MKNENIHFVTGRLAESALRNTLQKLAPQAQFEYTIDVMPITVAALLTTDWIAKRISIPNDATKVILPGYTNGNMDALNAVTSLPIELGPKDLRDLPTYFGQTRETPDFGTYTIDIIAEINHAPRLDLKTILEMADSMRADGANLIDVGCDPGSVWRGVTDCVRALKNAGHRVSVDSLNPKEIEPAVRAGAELVLSVNSSNRNAALDWGCEVVVIPDDIANLETMDETIDMLSTAGVPIRLDPILEPIGFGFAQSLSRYMKTRERWPDAAMMMGIGNLTELTDVDSAGVNMLLLAICEELRIESVLTTQVINWARSSVAECNIARRMVHYSINNKTPPKRISDQLIMLRDERLNEFGEEEIAKLAAQIRDHNYRIFAEAGQIHLIGGGHHFRNVDPFVVFDQLADTNPKNLDASHAFYLGFEMCKAMTALQLGKQYTQDEALNWGHLTVEEKVRHRLKKRKSTDR